MFRVDFNERTPLPSTTPLLFGYDVPQPPFWGQGRSQASIKQDYLWNRFVYHAEKKPTSYPLPWEPHGGASRRGKRTCRSIRPIRVRSNPHADQSSESGVRSITMQAQDGGNTGVRSKSGLTKMRGLTLIIQPSDADGQERLFHSGIANP